MTTFRVRALFALAALAKERRVLAPEALCDVGASWPAVIPRANRRATLPSAAASAAAMAASALTPWFRLA